MILGCALPIGYGVYDYLKKRKINFFSVLGLVAVLTKGIFGLLSLLGIIGIVAVLIYLVDVRPRVDSIQNKRWFKKV